MGSHGGREKVENRGGLETELFEGIHVSCWCFEGIAAAVDAHTDTKVSRPSEKSRVPKTIRDRPALSPLIQLFARRSHSGWNSLHSWHPNLLSRAVRRTATV